MTGKRRRRLLRTCALVVLLFAVLPNALYVGHWPFVHSFLVSEERAEAAPSAIDHSDPAAHAQATTQQAHERAGHCPSGPSRCSDFLVLAQLLPGIFQAAILVLLAGGLLTLLDRQSLISRLVPAFRLTPPPRTLSALPA